MGLEAIGLAAVLEDSNFQKGLSRYTSGLGQMTKLTDGATSAISGAFKVATGAMLVGLGGVAAALGVCVKAAAESQQVAEQTNAVLKSTGGVAGMTAEAVSNLAQAFSEVTPYEDDAVQGAENLLLTFTNIGKNVFPLATETILDMSQAMGQDLKASAIQLGKALQDPAKGVSALAEVGVNFNEVQKKTIEQLVKTGRVEEAQRLILKELQTEFGGAAKAAGKTLAGQLQILKNQLGNVQEEIGGALLPILTKLTGALVKALADPRVKSAIKTLTQATEFFGFALGDLFDLVQGKGDALDNLAADLASLGNQFGLDGGKIEQVVGKVGKALQRMVDAFKKGGFKGLFDELLSQLRAEWPGIQAQLSTWGTQFWDWTKGLAGQGVSKAQEIAGTLSKALQDNWPIISAQLAQWGTQFWGWLTQDVAPMVSANIFLLANSLNTAIKQNWPTVAAGLEYWKTQFWNWVTGRGGLIDTTAVTMTNLTEAIRAWTESEDVRNAMHDFGKNIASSVMQGIGDFFKDPANTDGPMGNLVTSLNQSIKNLGESIANLGGSLAGGITDAIIKRVTGKDMVESMRKAIDDWLSAAVQAFITGDSGRLAQKIIDAILGQLNQGGGEPAGPGGEGGGGEAAGPAFAKGGYVSQTGMALVHKGEYVIPARSSVTNANRILNGGPVTIQMGDVGGYSKSQIETMVEAGTYRAYQKILAGA